VAVIARCKCATGSAVALSASAHRALTSDNGFETPPAGPTEVRHLAASIGEFVDSLEQQNAQGNALLEAIPDALFVVDKNRGIVKVKPGNNPMITAAATYVASAEFADFLNTEQGVAARKLVHDCLTTQTPQTAEISVRLEGTDRIVEARASAINESRMVVVLRDLTRKREVEARIRHMAYHDSLTGLLNRRAFKEAISEQIENHEGYPFALLFVDADRFKAINDTHGHDMGDEVLKHITQCIQNCLRTSDTLSRKATEEHSVSARMGGDEFVVLLHGVHNAEIAERVAQRLQEAVAKPLLHDGAIINASVTVGAALYPSHGSTVDELMQNADEAMYQAKRSDAIQYCVYDEKLAELNRHRLDIEAKLGRAIAEKDIFLVYQPKIDLQTRKIVGAEALVRWQDGDTVIPPNEFIPIAEATGLILPLGESVLELAENAGVPTSALNIEITESLMLTHYERSILVLQQFTEGGFSIALDDFGTGYSSLSYLKDLPLDVLKIDRAFVSGIERSETERTIIATIIQLGKTLGMRIVAEGVETQEQADFLEAAGCDQAQGYYFSKPIAPEEMERLLLAEQTPAQIANVSQSNSA